MRSKNCERKKTWLRQENDISANKGQNFTRSFTLDQTFEEWKFVGVNLKVKRKLKFLKVSIGVENDCLSQFIDVLYIRCQLTQT